MDYHIIVGYLAAALQVIGISSQICHSYNTKSFQSQSKVRLMSDITTNTLTLVYAINVDALPICLSSSSVVVGSSVLFLAHMWQERKPQDQGKVTEEVGTIRQDSEDNDTFVDFSDEIHINFPA
jgi:uncharacterized protein with PQ loop repeat